MTVQQLALELIGLMARNDCHPNDTIAIGFENTNHKVDLGQIDGFSFGLDDDGKDCVYIDGIADEPIYS